MEANDPKPNVPIVDDQRPNLLAVQELLKDLPAKLVLAESGQEALGRLLEDETAGRHKAEEALSRSEALFITFMDNSPTVAFMKDADGRYVYVNATWQKCFGLWPEHCLGKTDYQVWPLETARQFAEYDDLVVAANHGMEPSEIMAERNGEQRHWLILKFPVNDASGRRLLGGVGVDITERKRAEEDLRTFAAQLQRSNAELQDFVTAASHDLQEPLRKIRAFGDRLKHTSAEALGDEGRDYLDRMENAAARMQTLIQDLLQYSRVTTKAQPFVPTDLAQTVLEVLSDLDIRIEQTGGRVEVAELPTVEADPLQMRELVQNLVGNALKFHRPGEPPLVRISARLLDPDGQPGAERETPQWCEISVADNGIGFEDKYAARIFDMFHRLHGWSQYEGSGLGLSICRKIVQRHGGRIVARSSPGQGATFLVTLPLCQSKMEGVAPCSDVPSLLRS